MASKRSRRGLVAQGKLDEALKSYRDSLVIAKRLAASDRSNTGWQRDLSVLYEELGALEEHKRFVLSRETRPGTAAVNTSSTRSAKTNSISARTLSGSSRRSF